MRPYAVLGDNTALMSVQLPHPKSPECHWVHGLSSPHTAPQVTSSNCSCENGTQIPWVLGSGRLERGTLLKIRSFMESAWVQISQALPSRACHAVCSCNCGSATYCDTYPHMYLHSYTALAIPMHYPESCTHRLLVVSGNWHNVTAPLPLTKYKKPASEISDQETEQPSTSVHSPAAMQICTLHRIIAPHGNATCVIPNPSHSLNMYI